jgi:hypothetical protein
VVPGESQVAVYNLEVQGAHVFHVTAAGALVHNATPRGGGYVYEITYVENGVTKTYIGTAWHAFERLWTNRSGNKPGNRGRDILRLFPEAKVRIWKITLPPGRDPRGALQSQAQRQIEEVKEQIAEINKKGGKAELDNAIGERNQKPGGAYSDSEGYALPKAEQDAIRAEIKAALEAEKPLPKGTLPGRTIAQMSKYDYDTLRHGDLRGDPVVEGTNAEAAKLAEVHTKPICPP